MLTSNNPEINVEELMQRIHAEVAQRQAALEKSQNNGDYGVSRSCSEGREPLDREKSDDAFQMLPLTADEANVISLEVNDVSAQVRCGQEFVVAVVLKNPTEKRLISCLPNPFHLSYHWFDEAGNPVLYDGMRTVLEPPLSSRSQAGYNVKVKSPDEPGRYRLQVLPVQESVRWHENANPNNGAIVVVNKKQSHEKSIGYHYVKDSGGQQNTSNVFKMFPLFADEAESITIDMKTELPEIIRGQEFVVSVILNNPTDKWLASCLPYPFFLSYHWTDESDHPIDDDVELRTDVNPPLSPQSSAFYDVKIQAPVKPGRYKLYVLPVQDLVRWHENACEGMAVIVK